MKRAAAGGAVTAPRKTRRRVGRPPGSSNLRSNTAIATLPAVAQAEHESRRAQAQLDAEQSALSAAQRFAKAARRKAAASGSGADKSAARRARQHVKRIGDRVTEARSRQRKARDALQRSEAQARLAQRVQLVEDRLLAANLVADSQMEVELEESVEQFRAHKLASLKKAEAKKRRKREAVAAKKIEALHKSFSGTGRAKRGTSKARRGPGRRKAATAGGR